MNADDRLKRDDLLKRDGLLKRDDLLKRYVAVWNEPDAAAREAEVANLWTPDGLHYTQTRRFQGTEQLLARVTEAHDQFVAGQGLRFRSGDNPVGHAGALTFNWLMTPGDSDTVLAVGSDVVLLDDEGRIIADYQFNEPPMPTDELDAQAERCLADGTAEEPRKELADLYLPGALYVDETGVHEGVDAIAAALVASGVRQRAGSASAQHDAFRYLWRTATGETGVDFLLRDEQGLIREHRRFAGAGGHSGFTPTGEDTQGSGLTRSHGPARHGSSRSSGAPSIQRTRAHTRL